MEAQLSLFEAEEFVVLRSKKLTTKQRATVIIERCNDVNENNRPDNFKDKSLTNDLKQMLADVKRRFDTNSLPWQQKQEWFVPMINGK